MEYCRPCESHRAPQPPGPFESRCNEPLLVRYGFTIKIHMFGSESWRMTLDVESVWMDHNPPDKLPVHHSFSLWLSSSQGLS